MPLYVPSWTGVDSRRNWTKLAPLRAVLVDNGTENGRSGCRPVLGPSWHGTKDDTGGPGRSGGRHGDGQVGTEEGTGVYRG